MGCRLGCPAAVNVHVAEIVCPRVFATIPGGFGGLCPRGLGSVSTRGHRVDTLPGRCLKFGLFVRFLTVDTLFCFGLVLGGCVHVVFGRFRVCHVRRTPAGAAGAGA